MALLSVQTENGLPICNPNGIAHMVLTRFGIFEIILDRVEGPGPDFGSATTPERKVYDSLEHADHENLPVAG